MKKCILSILAFLIISCNKVVPAKFWTKYRNSEIVLEKYDHGPFGGETEIKWKTKSQFNISDIIKFSEKNNWKFVNVINASKLKDSLNFSQIILTEKFNKSELEKSSILCFKTNLATINEDQHLETYNNCFAILNADKNKLEIYYRWGDF